MGISPSKRVATTLRHSQKFTAACASVFDESTALTQHAFAGILPYQLSSATATLHHSLLSTLPLLRRWVPSPPSQLQIDRAFRRRSSAAASPDKAMGLEEFTEFTAEVFADAALENANKAVAVRVPVGVAGIAGVGMVTKKGVGLIGTAIGVYALGVACSIYVSLSV